MGALAVSGGPATAVAKTRTKLASVAIVDRSPSASATLLRSVSLRLVMVGLANGIEWQLAPGPGQPSHDPPSKPCPARRLEAASYFSAVPQDQNLQQWPPAGQRCAPRWGSPWWLLGAGRNFPGGAGWRGGGVSIDSALAPRPFLQRGMRSNLPDLVTRITRLSVAMWLLVRIDTLGGPVKLLG